MHVRVATDRYSVDLVKLSFEATIEEVGYVGILGHIVAECVSEDNTELCNSLWSSAAYPLGFCSVRVSEGTPTDNDLQLIVQAYVTLKTGSKCSTCDVVHFDQYTMFYPLVHDEFVFVNESEELLFDLDLASFDYLTPFSIHEWAKVAADESECMFGVTVVHGVTTYSSEMDEVVSETEMEERLATVEMICREYKYQGAVMMDEGSEHRFSLLTDLTHAWGFKRLESPSSLVYYSSDSPLEWMLPSSFESWLEDSVHRLMLDLPPLLPHTDYRILAMKDKGIARSVYEMMCRNALKRCCVVDLDKSLDSLNVTAGLVAYVPAWGPKEYESFKSELLRMDPDNVQEYTSEIVMGESESSSWDTYLRSAHGVSSSHS